VRIPVSSCLAVGWRPARPTLRSPTAIKEGSSARSRPRTPPPTTTRWWWWWWWLRPGRPFLLTHQQPFRSVRGILCGPLLLIRKTKIYDFCLRPARIPYTSAFRRENFPPAHPLFYFVLLLLFLTNYESHLQRFV